MAERDFRAIADRFHEAFGLRHDAKAAAQLYAEDAVLMDPALPEALRGRKAIEEYIGAMLRAFPDLSGENTNIFGTGDYFVWEWVMRGTHTGPLVGPQGEIPPTGRRAEVRGCSVGRVNAQGLIGEDHIYFDTASMMQQLGLMPEARAA